MSTSSETRSLPRDANAQGQGTRSGDRGSMRLFAITTALGAFLLFLVQPLIGRFILPWFGSTPAVWAASMVVFQSLLLVGYGLAHSLARWLAPRGQSSWHVALALLVLLLLPIIPSAAWKPTADTEPMGRIALLLTVTIGLPFIVLAAGGPLLQRWFAHVHPGRSPYRLYALSNLGSMLALLGYPILVVPTLRLRAQAWGWSALYLVYLALLIVVVARVRRTSAPTPGPGEARSVALSPARVLLWAALAGCGSALLLASTNQMCQDVAVIPLLWIVPLALYLLSFVLCFERERWYARPYFFALLPATLIIACLILYIDVDLALGWQLAGYNAVLFVLCMLCHGELYRLRPPPARLTAFYLSIAAGGALGGMLVGIAAPVVLTGLWEFHASLLLCGVTLLLATRAGHEGGRAGPGRLSTWLLGLVALALTLLAHVRGLELTRDASDNTWSLERSDAQVIRERRGFYGLVQIREAGEPDSEYQQRRLLHGRIMHGMQYTHRDHSWRSTSYYGPYTGLGIALRLHPGRAFGGPLRVGAIGLGAGTVASYGKRGDWIRFYEINPDVIHFANEQFSFLADARSRGADVQTLLGDARLVLERQLVAEDLQGFDVLVVDAFSSDAIPIHLLTRECFELYNAHLAEDGIIAVNISNRHLDLRPVVRALAESVGMQAWMFETFDDDDTGVDAADWVLLTRNTAFLGFEDVLDAMTGTLHQEVEPILWTDDFSSVYALMLM